MLINNQPVLRVNSISFLGIIIDDKLQWNQHIAHIRSKIAKGIGIICKARKFFNKNILLTLYYCFIYPYMTYCIEVWGNAYKMYLNTIEKLQKRAIRIITCSSYRCHTAPLFCSLNILNLSNTYLYFITLFMFKYESNSLPDIFKHMFTKNRDIHKYSTRYCEHLNVPKVKTTAYKNTIKCTGVTLWNYFAKNIDYQCGISVFKSRLKTFLKSNNIILSDITKI